jgi:hypothetical protein
VGSGRRDQIPPPAANPAADRPRQSV